MWLLVVHLVSQDLSVAGKRAGLAGERSGLFMEQIRIIKEMRNESERRLRNAGADYDRSVVKPRYMVWENVSGTFSSNAGEDFRAVLEETAKVADKDAVIPGLEGGKWSPCGCILGNGWSIAWRLHDAQYYGVPQRRKRICLLADFNGDTAGRILFELQRKTTKSNSEQTVLDSGKESGPEVQSVSEGVSGDTEACRKEGERVTEDTERCAGETSTIAFEPGAMSRVGGHMYDDDVAGTVRANAGDNQQAVVYGIGSYDSNAMKSDNPHSGIYKADTSRTLDLNGGNPGCNQGGMAVVQGADMYNGAITGDIAATLNCGERQGVEREIVAQTYQYTTGTLSPGAHAGSYNGQDAYNDMLIVDAHAVDCRNATENEMNGSLQAKASNNLNSNNVCRVNSVVRRLTPMECERLQGFKDGWTDIGDWVDSKGKMHKGESDAPRYKALGNSIALPFWQWMAERMMPYLGDKPTMASLFSGIGGFELVFSRAGCKPVWASEVENFAIAVTKKRFPEE